MEYINIILGENPSWDAMLLLIVASSIIFLAFLGRARLIALAVATYITITLLTLIDLYSIASTTSLIPSGISGIIATTTILTLAIFTLVHFSIKDTLQIQSNDYPTSAVTSATITGLLIAFLSTQIPPETLTGFSAIIQTLFSGPIMLAAWILAPIVIIGATRD